MRLLSLYFPLLTSLVLTSSVVAQYHDIASRAAFGLQCMWFNSTTGIWPVNHGSGRWNNANSVHSLCNFIKFGAKGLEDKIQFGVLKQLILHDLNQYFSNQENIDTLLDTSDDDSLWFALAWNCMYEATQETKYLDFAVKFYDSVDSTGWDEYCNGGIWWDRKTRSYKNAITNELYLTTSVKLWRNVMAIEKKEVYKQNALKEWNWFSQSGMVNSDGLINDGLDFTTCKNNGGITWTYNQGTILSELVQVSKWLGNTEPIKLGLTVAHAVMNNLVSVDGVLQDVCEKKSTGCDIDAMQFKGAYVRFLSDFLAELQFDHQFDQDQVQLKQFLMTNVNSLVTKTGSISCSGVDVPQFGYRWTGASISTSVSQTAGLDLLNSILRLGM